MILELERQRRGKSFDEEEFSGTLFDLVDNTIKCLQNHLYLQAKIEGLRQKEKYEIPITALREAVLNALIHRDYTRQSDVKVAIYDHISDGRSVLRNKVVANLFKELGYVEI